MRFTARSRGWGGGIAGALALLAMSSAAHAQLKLSQVYGGGGLLASGYNADFVEIYNAGSSPASLAGVSLQASGSATGTTWTVINLSGSVAANGYYLVRLESASATGQPFIADLVANPLTTLLTSGAGKVALVTGSTALTTSGCPVAAPIIDLVSYTTSTTATGCYEGAVGNAVTVSGGGGSVVRRCGGARDNNDNRNDFASTIRPPRNAAFGPNTDASQVTVSLAASPIAPTGGQTVLFTAPASVCTGTVAGVTIDLSQVGGSAAQAMFDDGTHGDVTAGDGTYSFAGVVSGASGAHTVSVSATSSGGGSGSASTSITIVCDGYNPPVTGSAPIEDISASPSATQLALGDDTSSAAIPIPFTFRFFGVAKPALIINSNGWLGFDTSGTQPTASQMRVPVVPMGGAAGSVNPPNDIVAVLWRDLNQNTGQTPPQTVSYEVRGSAPYRRFIAQWQVAQFSNTGYNVFEAILYEGSDVVELRYGTFTAATTNATFGAGLENASGTIGVDIPATTIQPNTSYLIVPAPGACSSVAYPTGACCAGAACTSGTQAACQTGGGSFQGGGSACSPNPCTVGACCELAGSCSIQLQSACLSAGGVYQGNTTVCGAAACPPTGRCCSGATCTIAFAAGCGGGGVWTGGATCSPNLCAGSCCSSAGVCTLAASAASCSGTFGALGSTCSPSPCPGQACESPIAIALNSPLAGDLAASASNSTITCSSGTKGLWYTFTAPSAGSYAITSTLTTGTGNPSLGIFQPCGTQIACVNPCGGTVSTATVPLNAGETIVFRAGGCGDIQLTWSVGVSAALVGACCNTTSGACTSSSTGSPGCASGAVYQGDNSFCTPNPCGQGACCNPTTGVCSLTTATGCASPNVFQTTGTVCSPNPCPQPPPPANDDCSAAVALTAGTSVGGSTANATQSVTATCTGSVKDVWYTFTAPAAGSYGFTATVDAGSATAAIPSVSIFSSCPATSGGNDAAPAGCQAQGGTGFVQRAAMNAGDQLWVRVADFAGDTTTFHILATLVQSGACCNTGTGACTTSNSGASGCGVGTTYQGDNTACTPNPCPQPPPPSNDECGSGNPALTPGVAYTSSSTNATTSVTLAGAACPGITASDGGSRDVFLTFTPTATAAYTLNTCGSGFDTILSIHSGCPASDANLLACNDDSSQPAGNIACTDSQLRSRIQSVTLAAGTSYTVRIAGFNGASGAYTIVVNAINATGSCCVGMNCSLADAANCPGAFITGGTCFPGACGGTSGVCCRGATCNNAIAAVACTASGTAGAAFVASSSACNAPGATSVPCCYADYNKVGGISVQDIFDFLADWFAGNPYANTGSNGSGGPLAVQNIFDFLSAWFAGGC